MNPRQLPPNIFAMVMATGIVSLAAKGIDWGGVAWVLFIINVLLFPVLICLFAARCRAHWDLVWADLHNHAVAPGFFTIVAATCIVGNQFVLLDISLQAGRGLWFAGVAVWALLTYTVLPWLMERDTKPPLEKCLNGAWLIAVVGTQAVSILAASAAPVLPETLGPFIALCFWLVGGMLYLWLISLIFYRIMFLPLPPGDLSPPYWINMGAMAISTLAGARVVGLENRSPLLAELLPFLKGMTLFYWATATWWIPLLLALGIWRHVARKVPLHYDHGYWSVVFPLGMFSVATRAVADGFGLPFLVPIATVFAYIALATWTVVAVSLIVKLGIEPATTNSPP